MQDEIAELLHLAGHQALSERRLGQHGKWLMETL